MPTNIRLTDTWLSFGLAFVGGYGDAAGFVLAKTFTGHVTGNLVLGAIAVRDRPAEALHYERAQPARADFESDYRIVLPDGLVKHIHNIGHPKVNESGE